VYCHFRDGDLAHNSLWWRFIRLICT